eukprot:UN15824
MTNSSVLPLGVFFTCGLLITNKITCWGSDQYGTDEYGILYVPRGENYVSVEAGGFHVYAQQSTGIVDCWGLSTSDQTNVPGSGYDR